MMEAGVNGLRRALWFAYVTPAGTSDAIVGKLDRAMTEILNEPEAIENLRKPGFERTPPARRVAERIRSETAKWRAWWPRPASSRSDPLASCFPRAPPRLL